MWKLINIVNEHRFWEHIRGYYHATAYIVENINSGDKRALTEDEYKRFKDENLIN